MTAPPPEPVVVYAQPATRGSGVGYFILGFVTCGLLVLVLASWPVTASDEIGNTPVVVDIGSPAPKPAGTTDQQAVRDQQESTGGCPYTNPYIDEYVQHPPC